MTIALWSLVILIGAAFVIAVIAICFNAGDNEFLDGAEIHEEELAGAIEGDLRAFVADENSRRCTGRLVNYTADEKARAVV